MESAYKRAQVIWAAVLFSAFVYSLLPEWINARVRPANTAFIVAFACMAAFLLFSIVSLRGKLLTKSEAAVRKQPGDQKAAKRWMATQILTIALAEAIVLDGLVVRFTGGGRTAAVPFYVAGIGAMLIFRPKRIE